MTGFTDIKSTHFHIGIIVFTALIILAPVIGLAYMYYRRRHSKIIGRRNNEIDKFCHNPKPATNGSKNNLICTFYPTKTPANFEFEQKCLPMEKDRFEIRPDQLTIKDILGSGASGIVRLGSYQSSENLAIDVAIKTLRGTF